MKELEGKSQRKRSIIVPGAFQKQVLDGLPVSHNRPVQPKKNRGGGITHGQATEQRVKKLGCCQGKSPGGAVGGKGKAVGVCELPGERGKKKEKSS